MAWGRGRAGRGACRRPEPERHFLAAPENFLTGPVPERPRDRRARPRRGAEDDTSVRGASRRSCPPPVGKSQAGGGVGFDPRVVCASRAQQLGTASFLFSTFFLFSTEEDAIALSGRVISWPPKPPEAQRRSFHFVVGWASSVRCVCSSYFSNRMGWAAFTLKRALLPPWAGSCPSLPI